jgi:hypothetical protein
MAVEIAQKRNRLVVDKTWLRQQFAEKDARSGFSPDPTATPQRVREMMLADGIKPEDNAFSREILRERYEEDV